MAEVSINGSGMGTQLQQLMMCEDLVPGYELSYQTAKTIYEYHPLGAKIAESPIKLAQSQKRDIAIPGSPEDRIKKAFEAEWDAIGADKHILNVKKLSRIYGVASIALVSEEEDASTPLKFDSLYKSKIGFNAFDPLNTAGSLVLNQNPNAIDFQKHGDIRVGPQTYHKSRTVVLMNEQPIYIGYTTTAYGYVGRSVYQRCLFPLKSFLQTLITDDLVVRKVGVLVAKMEQPGSIIDKTMTSIFARKREVVKDAQTGNVIGIGKDEDVQSLNLQNLDGPYALVRTNILKNVATAADMPAMFIENETLTSGFGEGTEDAKNIAHYIDGMREEMAPVYAWFDKIVMHRAWNPDFYQTIQNDIPEYQGMDYQEAFYRWSNAFSAEWPSLLTEPESEQIKVEDTKLKAAISAVEALAPMLDPENKANLVSWLAATFNEQKILFPTPLMIDMDALTEYVPPEPPDQSEEPRAEEL